ncbi:chemotaxis protein [Pseudoalteromonas sp. NZS127_1]|uniref:chemotaxis protein n=1 Tax=unclassified Pseudoalteromonas TaxID=194690 RepID=UPI0013FDF91E|nr:MULTISPECIES: chemotaxis protein [unclassified Pseudoalteromonas]MBG9997284.1 chemotaxis protein [Pseudoalteromonas sp. NZS127_1]MBH0014370.1 chemotaxis protein [Pseudoalteromonas sp. NZS100_1]MBH0042642.1 chemotaxis protein [Pseudoalteromonas sp. SWXJZ10B]MBH0050131.1 chemotaxis protein [Pseudoalteromonas sp. SWYJZ19]MBH0076807.1 chemotaxis protein [Pseudoalteromonas sp. SWYJ118]
MELINFKVGCKTISLKILDILLTERFDNNLTTLPNNNKSFIGVKDYMDIPTPVFDLGIILNNISTEQSNAHVLKQLRTWQEKLLNWFNTLQSNLLNSSASISSNDAELQDFVLFYKEFNTDNEDLKLTMSRLNEPFQSLLETVKEAISAHNQSDYKQVSALLEKIKRSNLIQLERLFESAKEQITLDYKPIIVFTTKDGLNPHVGLLVDKVEDNIDYKKEDIKPLDKLTEVGFDLDPQTKNMMRGLIKLTQKHSVLIDPSVIFKPTQLEESESEETQAYGLF